ncbi:MAG TPA: hypothetical protein VH415_09715 [Nitrososphaeraceae archaeon]
MLIFSGLSIPLSSESTTSFRYVYAQEFPDTVNEQQLCVDGLSPDPATGLCSDGLLPPTGDLNNFSQSASPEIQLPGSQQLAIGQENGSLEQQFPVNETTGEFNQGQIASFLATGDAAVTTGQEPLCSDGLPPTAEGTCPDGNAPISSPIDNSEVSPPDAAVSTGQEPLCSDGLPPTAEGTCPDGNAPISSPTDNSEVIPSPANTATGSNQFGGATGGQSTTCIGELAAELPQARKTLEEADLNAKDYVRLLQAGGGIKQYPISNLYWFAKLYSDTTYLEIRDLNKVEHPAMIAHFIPIFFGLYKQAIDSYMKRDYQNIPAEWMNHFKSSQDAKVSLTGAQVSIESAVPAHIQGDMPKAFVQAYKSFVSKYCPNNPPTLDYFRSSFFGPAALKIFPESQAGLFLELARIFRPPGTSIEQTQLGIRIGSEIFNGLDINTVYKWREQAWEDAKKILKQ